MNKDDTKNEEETKNEQDFFPDPAGERFRTDEDMTDVSLSLSISL